MSDYLLVNFNLFGDSSVRTFLEDLDHNSSVTEPTSIGLIIKKKVGKKMKPWVLQDSSLSALSEENTMRQAEWAMNVFRD